MELTEVLLKIKEKEERIAQLLSNKNPATHRNMMSFVSQAEGEIEDLRAEYRKMAYNSSILMFMVGENLKLLHDVVDKSEQEFGCYQLDIDQFISELVKDIPTESYLNQTPSSDVVLRITEVLRNIGRDIGISEFNFPSLQNMPTSVMRDKDDLKLFATHVLENIGVEVISLYAVHMAASQAVTDNYEGNVLPIIIYSTSHQWLTAHARQEAGRAAKNNFMITCGPIEQLLPGIVFDTIESASKKQIQNVLAGIRASLK